VITRRIVRSLDTRLGTARFTRHAVDKAFPDNWSFMLGEVALYSFLVLLVTGVYLVLFFDPSESETIYHGSYPPLEGQSVSSAYASTVRISWDVRAGLLIRQTHHWAALIFVAAIVLHLSRIFFTGAFRRPREMNWVIGVTMLILAMLNGFAGYSLPDDLLSGTGLHIAWAVVLSLPVIGPYVAFAIFGNEFPGDIIPRLYAVHILLIPALLVALISLHMIVLIRQKHTHFSGPGRRDTTVVGSRLWPTYALRSLSLFAAVAAVSFALGGLVQINPVWLWGPFEPGSVTSPAQPDWYVGWVDGALRLFPPWEFRVFGYLVPSVLWPAVVMPMLTFGVIYAWPWVERRLTGDRAEHHVLERPRQRPWRVALGAWALAFYALLLGSGATDLVARELRVPVLTVLWVARAATVVVPFIVAAVAYLVAVRLLRHSLRKEAEFEPEPPVPVPTSVEGRR
jgi:ubiquinol-cytochrome c reductase cytochrome b subunit